MSFSSKVKEELLKLRTKGKNEKLCTLCALTHAAGSIRISRAEGIGIRYVTENLGVAKLTAQLGAELFKTSAYVSVTESARLRARNSLVDLSGEGCRELLNVSGCMPVQDTDGLVESRLPMELMESDDDRRAFLRGIFLGCGSLSDPRKGYHLEFVCRHEGFAFELSDLLNIYGLGAKTLRRKTSYIVYIKDSEHISDFLALVGAMGSTMDFEHTRVIRNVANNVNRRNNFDTANIDKTAEAAARQMMDIRLIAAEIGLKKLPPKLRQTAEVRLNNPEAPLSELASMLDIGRSGVNHRLCKLSEIAEAIRLEKGKPV